MTTVINGYIPWEKADTENKRYPYLGRWFVFNMLQPNSTPDQTYYAGYPSEFYFQSEGVSVTNVIDFITPWFSMASGISTFEELFNSPHLSRKEKVVEFFSRNWRTEFGDIPIMRYRTVTERPTGNLLAWLDSIPECDDDNKVYTYQQFNKGCEVEVPFTPKWTDVQNYRYKMDNNTHKFFRKISDRDGSVQLGVENEVTSKISGKKLQQIVQGEEPKQEPFFIFKEDSSIRGTSNYPKCYEIVTPPMSLKKHRKEWKTLFDKLGDDIPFEAENSSCGMHIHISKDFFADQKYVTVDGRKFRVSKANKHTAKFLLCLNPSTRMDNKFLGMVSERPGGLNSFCQPSDRLVRYRLKYQLDEAPKITRSGGSGSCVIRDSTIEVRIFQSAYNYEQLAKNLEFVEAVFDWTFEVSVVKCGGGWSKRFCKWVETQKKYPHLRKFLKENQK